MSHRAPWKAFVVVLVALALGAAGCGRQQHPLEPQVPPDGSLEAGLEALPEDGGSSFAASPEEAEAIRHARPVTGPTIISSPGNYRLEDDLEATGDGIVITASDVRLWLGEHRLRGPGNKAGRGVVIAGARNVRVVGGRIERFGIGVVLDQASGCSVVRVGVKGGDETADPAAGNPPQIGVMLVNSAHNAIARNRFRDVNLGIFVRGGGSYRNRIDGNRVVGGEHGLLAICYNPAPGGDPAGPREDRVRHNLLARFGTGIVTSAHSAENAFALNVIRYFDAAWVDENGSNVFRHNRAERLER